MARSNGAGLMALQLSGVVFRDLGGTIRRPERESSAEVPGGTDHGRELLVEANVGVDVLKLARRGKLNRRGGHNKRSSSDSIAVEPKSSNPSMTSSITVVLEKHSSISPIMFLASRDWAVIGQSL